MRRPPFKKNGLMMTGVSENFHGVNVVPPLLINMVCAGGYQFNKFKFVELLTPKSNESSSSHRLQIL